MIRIQPTAEEREALKKQKVTVGKDEFGNEVRQMTDMTVLENMIRRWKRAVKDAEIIEECKRRECFYNKAEKRREKAKRAKIRRIQEEKAFAKRNSK